MYVYVSIVHDVIVQIRKAIKLETLEGNDLSILLKF